MNLFDQTSTTAYLVVVVGIAALGMTAALGVIVEAAVRAWRSSSPRRVPPQRPSATDVSPGTGQALASD
jgi:ABC-type uncharacterized transport system YnjBCD permease subunit